jgi:cell fate regulator YaaT (PSP1 superfamily)
MACLGCSCSTGKDSVGGCGSNGGCASGGCNRHNTYDWITALGIRDAHPFEVAEVSFKNGSRKEFFKNPSFTRTTTGDEVLVESPSGGYDVGTITLSGEMVRLQMKRKRVREDAKLMAVIRKAHERDLERLDEVRKMERDTMVRARVVARTLGLDMKIGDVEYQGDGRKCTFYYTADGRVDFRELIRHYAREFKVKIEMRQIGARQESARIGGLGNCGRELCCSTWLTEFKSVNTAAARYQNLAINQTKLSGMCGRLKCCLNYELDAYVDALEDFPDRADRLRTQNGPAILIKTDVFKRLMYYTYSEERGRLYALHVDQVWEWLDMLKRNEQPPSLEALLDLTTQAAAAGSTNEPEEETPDFENVENVLELPFEKRKKKKKKKPKQRDRSQSVAAAVEKIDEAEQRRGPSTNRGTDRRDNRNRPPQNNAGDGQQRPPRPENRPPQQQGGPQKPKQDQPRNDRPPQNNPGGSGQQKPAQDQNRPPQNQQGGQQKPKQEQPRSDRPPQNNNQQGGQQKPAQDQNRPPQNQQGGQQKPKQEQPRNDRPPQNNNQGGQKQSGNNRPPQNNNQQGGPQKPKQDQQRNDRPPQNNPDGPKQGGNNKPPQNNSGGGQKPKQDQNRPPKDDKPKQD